MSELRSPTGSPDEQRLDRLSQSAARGGPNITLDDIFWLLARLREAKKDAEGLRAENDELLNIHEAVISTLLDISGNIRKQARRDP